MKQGLRLIPVFLLFGLIASAAEYYPYADYAVAIIYLWALLKAGSEFPSLKQTVAGSFIAQLPGIIFWLFTIDAYFGSHTMPPEFAYLVMLWFAPFLPITALFHIRLDYYNLYFILMAFTPIIAIIVMGMGYYLKSVLCRKQVQ